MKRIALVGNMSDQEWHKETRTGACIGKKCVLIAFSCHLDPVRDSENCSRVRV